MTTQTNPRIKEIQSIWEQYQGLYVVGGIFIGLMLFPFLELIINDLSELLIGLVPEAIGIGFTVFFLDHIYQRREVAQLKKRLIGEVGSQSNETAKSAVDWMRREGWLNGKNSLLRGVDLRRTNLQNADLFGINLEGTSLFEANLQYATLATANLTGANIRKANLKGVIWLKTIRGIKYTTILPDGTKWTPETDMARFTDKDHKNYEETRVKIRTMSDKFNLIKPPEKPNPLDIFQIYPTRMFES